MRSRAPGLFRKNQRALAMRMLSGLAHSGDRHRPTGGREGLRRIRSGCGVSITVLGNERGVEAALELLRELVGDIERAPAHCSE